MDQKIKTEFYKKLYGEKNKKMTIDQAVFVNELKQSPEYETLKKYIPLELCKGNVWKMCLAICIKLSDLAKCAEMTDQTEIRYLLKVSGGIVEAEIGAEFANCYKFDINSAYPNELIASTFCIPVKAGTKLKLKNISEIDLKNHIGIYKLKVLGDVNPLIFKKTNDCKNEGYYTTQDIKALKHLKLSYELVQDKDPENAIVWNVDECLTGKNVFREIIQSLYNIKSTTKSQNTKNIVKELLSKIWGTLCEHTKDVLPMSEIANINQDDIKYIDWENEKITLKQNFFKYYLARLQPFLMSAQRLRLTKITNSLIKNKFSVVYVNTDSIITSATPEQFEKFDDIGKDIGDWKIEQFYDGKHQIIHKHKIDKI